MDAVGWLVRVVGTRALRLLQLHVLWIVGTLCGGVLLGIGPSTAAVVAVLRRDQLWGVDGEWGRREPVTREFADTWRRELWSATRLAAVLALAVAVLGANLLALRMVPRDGWAAASSGLLLMLTVLTASTTVLAWSMHGHFEESTRATLRRCLVLTVGRPWWALVHMVGTTAVALAYYWLPGLAVVFGVALPVMVSLTVLQLSGVVPVPEGARRLTLRPPRRAVGGATTREHSVER